jgi:hypothetical protein
MKIGLPPRYKDASSSSVAAQAQSDVKSSPPPVPHLAKTKSYYGPKTSNNIILMGIAKGKEETKSLSPKEKESPLMVETEEKQSLLRLIKIGGDTISPNN